MAREPKKAAAKKATAKKATAKKATAKKATAKKATAKKATAKKATAKKATAKKATAKKATAKKATAKKATAKKATAKKATAKKATAKKATAKKAAPGGEMLSMEAEFAVAPATLFEAWIDPAKHAAMTRTSYEGGREVGDTFAIDGGYITGRHIALTPGEHIVQAWRTKEFGAKDPDSHLELVLLPHRMDGRDGTRLLLVHAGLPAGGASRYARGWAEFYFAPMTEYFATGD